MNEGRCSPSRLDQANTRYSNIRNVTVSYSILQGAVRYSNVTYAGGAPAREGGASMVTGMTSHDVVLRLGTEHALCTRPRDRAPSGRRLESGRRSGRGSSRPASESGPFRVLAALLRVKRTVFLRPCAAPAPPRALRARPAPCGRAVNVSVPRAAPLYHTVFYGMIQ